MVPRNVCIPCAEQERQTQRDALIERRVAEERLRSEALDRIRRNGCTGFPPAPFYEMVGVRDDWTYYLTVHLSRTDPWPTFKEVGRVSPFAGYWFGFTEDGHLRRLLRARVEVQTRKLMGKGVRTTTVVPEKEGFIGLDLGAIDAPSAFARKKHASGSRAPDRTWRELAEDAALAGGIDPPKGYSGM
jgi:hypothetical protein